VGGLLLVRLKTIGGELGGPPEDSEKSDNASSADSLADSNLSETILRKLHVAIVVSLRKNEIVYTTVLRKLRISGLVFQ
jgi:hypothetical protein